MGNQNEYETTELVWPGKNTEVDRTSLPFQTVETVNKPRVKGQLSFDTWPDNYPKDWKNKLIWGDNKYVMSSLLNRFAGNIDLIYIDPPFATGADFTYEIEIGDQEVTKESSVLEEVAYRDTWGEGMSSYLTMMYTRLVLMRELLSDRGSIYVHCDWRVNSYLRQILDEIFGIEHFRNEIIWSNETASGFKSQAKKFIRGHDTILCYAKGEEPIFNKQFLKRYSEATVRRYDKKDEDGRRYKIYYEDGEKRRQYLDESKGKPILDVWTDLPSYQTMNASKEYIGFPTQKPEGVLKRIIKSSSNEGSIVADFFCGSGTTGAVAEKLGRRWIMSDLSKFSIQTTRKRLLNLHNYSKDYPHTARPFEILNMGNYQKHKFIENDHPPVEQYIEFILDLYQADPLSGYDFIHGKKGRKHVHVAGVDTIVTEGEVRDVVEECIGALGGKEVDILGWDFEMGLDQLVTRMEDEYEAKINLIQIPKETLELKNSNEEIRFFDLNYLEVSYRLDGNKAIVELEDFVIANPEYLPEEAQEAIDGFTDYIDYWAIDFNYQEDTFHNMWQSFRTRNDSDIDRSATHRYDDPGEYDVLIKVVDVFGNDTNKLVSVEVK